MNISPEHTPNPNAFKFTVGVPVGGPGTHVKGSSPEEEWVADLLQLEGVTSIFFTADFVTISKTPNVDWDAIVPEATRILEDAFGDHG
jgi:hypothetical protein